VWAVNVGREGVRSPEAESGLWKSSPWGSVLGDLPVEHPAEELLEVAGLAVAATAADLQGRQRRRQLHPAEPFLPAARYGEDVVAAVFVDGDGVVLSQVPAVLVGAHDVPVHRRRLQRHRLHAL